MGPGGRSLRSQSSPGPKPGESRPETELPASSFHFTASQSCPAGAAPPQQHPLLLLQAETLTPAAQGKAHTTGLPRGTATMHNVSKVVRAASGRAAAVGAATTAAASIDAVDRRCAFSWTKCLPGDW